LAQHYERCIALDPDITFDVDEIERAGGAIRYGDVAIDIGHRSPATDQARAILYRQPEPAVGRQSIEWLPTTKREYDDKTSCHGCAPAEPTSKASVPLPLKGSTLS
jgi:hypothetical protein